MFGRSRFADSFFGGDPFHGFPHHPPAGGFEDVIGRQAHATHAPPFEVTLPDDGCQVALQFSQHFADMD